MSTEISSEALVTQAVEDHIADTGKLPSTTDVINRVEMGGAATRSILDKLVSGEKLIAVYEAPKNPTIYIPSYMYEAVLRKQRTPPWMKDYGFAAADQIQSEIRDQEAKLESFRKFESLLYSTGRVLEEAVGEACRYLEFESLCLPYEDVDSWDVSFTYDDVIYIFDVKGKGRWADKKDVAQLQQWLQKYVDVHADVEAEKLCGGLIVNHFKDEAPSRRWPSEVDRSPLSEAGVRYLKLGSGVFLTTVDLFDAVKSVEAGKIGRKEGRARVIKCLRRSLQS